MCHFHLTRSPIKLSWLKNLPVAILFGRQATFDTEVEFVSGMASQVLGATGVLTGVGNAHLLYAQVAVCVEMDSRVRHQPLTISAHEKSNSSVFISYRHFKLKMATYLYHCIFGFGDPIAKPLLTKKKAKLVKFETVRLLQLT